MPNEEYEFGPFRFDAGKLKLTCEGEPVPLKAKACELLLVLLSHQRDLLDKETLMDMLWPDTVVEENNLTVHMTALRKALGDSPNEHRYIVTIPGRGYRWVAEARVIGAERELVLAERTRATVTIEEEIEEEVETSMGERRALLPPGRSFGRVLSVAVILVAVAAVAGYWRMSKRNTSSQPPAPPAIKSLAVLPFKSLDAKPGEEYLSIGIPDVMITRLSNLSQLAVRPTSSVLPFASQDALQAGQALKVDSVLDGTIQRQGDRVRLTLRLLRVADGQPLWAYQCDEKCQDVFALQDTISNKVTEVLALTLTGDERQRLTKRYTQNAAAYQEYVKGRFYTLQYTPDGFKNAVEHLNEAIKIDPTYALAYAGLADSYTAASEWLLAPREALSKAKAAAERALSLDDTLSEAHAALGHVQIHRLDPAAEREFQRALELNPNSVSAMFWYGEYFMGRDYSKGVAILRRVQELDPLSPITGSFIVSLLVYGRQPEQALEEARKALGLDPNNSFSRGMLAVAYDLNGNYNEAIAELEQVKQSDITPQQMGTLGRAYALAGRRDDARRIMAAMNQLSKRQYVSPFDIAVVQAALGEKDHAFDSLEKAHDDQSEWMGWLADDYRMDSLRSDPRFADLMQRVGLKEQ